MAADTTLVEGAYRAAMAGSGKGLIASKAITEIGQDVAKKGMQFVQEKMQVGEDYDAYAQKVLDESGELSKEEYTALYDELQSGRNDYIWGDKKSKSLAIRDLNMKAKDYGQYKEFRQTLSDAQLNKLDGLSAGWKGEERDDIMNLLKDPKRLQSKTCNLKEYPNNDCPDKGRMGVMVGGEWTDISTLSKKISENTIDGNSRDLLKTYADKYLYSSSIMKEGQDAVFNKNYISDQITQNLVGKSKNKNSLVYDEMIPGRTFYADLQSYIQGDVGVGTEVDGRTYESLGITSEQLESADTNIDGIIDANEAKIIADALIANEGLRDGYLTQYFTNHVQKQWDHGVLNRVKATKEGKDENDQKYNIT